MAKNARNAKYIYTYECIYKYMYVCMAMMEHESKKCLT